MCDTAALRCASIVMAASSTDQAEAKKRFLAIMNVLANCQSGWSKTAAVVCVAAKIGVSTSTIWRWLRRVEGWQPVPAVWMRGLLPRPEGRKPHPAHLHLHRDSEILSLEEVL